MANHAHYLFALGIASGMSQVDAYQQAYPAASENAARANGSKLMKEPEVLRVIQSIHEADGRETRWIRAEIVSQHLADMRNEDLAPQDRRAARVALAKMLGLESPQVLKVESDAVEAFARYAMERAAAEPMVKK